MERKYLDCRAIPSESGCSLTIAGTEEEVMRVATRHAIEDHRELDSPQLQSMLRSSLKDEPSARGTTGATQEEQVGVH